MLQVEELKYMKDGKWHVLSDGAWDGAAGSYDVSATPQDDVKLKLLSNGDGTYTALLFGTGATKNFTKANPVPWADLAGVISAIVIGKGVTSIGDYLFNRHEAVRSLSFEDSSTIVHLGEKAFQGCAFDGEFSFPNLSDEEMAQVFSHCTKLEGLTFSANVKTITGAAFTGCLSLRYVHGVGNVQRIKPGAFINTPMLDSLDLDPDVCTDMEESAFLLSGNAMRYANLSTWEKTTFGRNAIPSITYSGKYFEELANELPEIRAVGLPNVPEREVNADAVYKYTDIPYCRRTLDGINEQVMLSEGCQAASLYHLFNWLNGAPYDSLGEWWQKEILDKYQSLDGLEIYEHDISIIREEVERTLGWSDREGFPMPVNTKGEESGFESVGNANDVKAAIADELKAGRPMTADIRYFQKGEGHAVAIIGSNAVTDKLIVVDPVRTSGDRGCVYEVAFEQLFGDYGTCMAYGYDFEGGDG